MKEPTLGSRIAALRREKGMTQAELAAQPVIDATIPLIYAVISIGTLISIEVIISFAVTKIPFLKPIFDGKPSILISKGKLDTKECQRVRISLEELLSQLRIAGVADIADVDYAILEQNGQLSVIQKKHCSPPDRDDLKLKPTESGIAHALIIDSKISEYDLKYTGHDLDWLKSRLKHHKTSLIMHDEKLDRLWYSLTVQKRRVKFKRGPEETGRHSIK